MVKNIIFFGNWGIGFCTLKKLLSKKNVNILYICTQYDENNKDKYFNMVYNLAIENNIEVISLEQLEKIDIPLETIGISVAFHKIIKKTIISKFKIINFHSSNLPNYRGPSPILWQLKDRKTSIGITAHQINEQIDKGIFIANKNINIDYSLSYYDFIELINEETSKFILSIISKDYMLENKTQSIEDGPYYPRLSLPNCFQKKSLKEISDFLNRDRIVFFTGNRAEIGIMIPMITELSKSYRVEIIASGSHVLKKWNTINYVKDELKNAEVIINTIDLHNLEDSKRNEEQYIMSFCEIFKNYYYKEITKLNLDAIKFNVVLGDRIETLAFTISSFYMNIPVIHICGGDVVNVPFFDTNVRHAITKLSHLHLTTNNKSKEVIKQLGEQEWRICNIGNLSFDYERLGMLKTREELINKYGINCDKVVILTIHPDHSFSQEENINLFKYNYEVIYKLKKELDFELIITSPNNDPSGSEMLELIYDIKSSTKDVKFVNNLGSKDYFSIMKHFKTIIVGNSSSGILETSYFNVPAINIGNRQTDRFCSKNVYHVKEHDNQLEIILRDLIDNYDEFAKAYKNDNFFGDGTAGIKAKQFIDTVFKNKSKQDILYKGFVIND